jgi:hypothetical protein
MSPFRPSLVRGKLVTYTQIVNYFSEVAKNIFTIQRVLVVISDPHASHHTVWKLHKLNVTINIVDFLFLCGLWVVVVCQGGDNVFCWVIN